MSKSKLKLNIKDRLVFSTLIPKQSDSLTLSMLKEIQEKVSFTEKEKKNIKLRTNPKTGIEWDNKIAKDKEIELSQSEISVLKEQVKRLDDNKQVSIDNLDLVNKIKNL